ncbi:MAG: hypothetical protein M1821_003341 [Bathelium mastoideum]|nr:MAG: hypothetical protein M1821_003341 [Bathelium mastoideum]
MSQTNEEIQQMDSIDAQDPGNKSKKEKNRRPANTAFRQQRLRAWQPILTPKTVLPLFFAVGIIFAPLGGLLLWASASVEEIAIDYSDCSSAPLSPQTAPIPSGKVTSNFKSKNQTGPSPYWTKRYVNVSYPDTPVPIEQKSVVNTTVCSLFFQIPDNIGPPVFLYYRLTDFYQNHRRYVKSYDQDQLAGQLRDNNSISSSDCDPLRIDPETNKTYYPCGLIANSIFNDTISSPTWIEVAGSSDANQTYFMTSQGTAWSSDRDLYKPTAYTADQVVPPPNWRLQYPTYNETFPLPNLQDWDAFQIWMRTAGLPTFSKLSLRNDTAAMKSGWYYVDVNDYFPVTVYGGTKSILISTRTAIGGKNPFLGIAYVVVAGICVLLGALFTATHLIKPRKLGDHTYLSWNNEQPSTAITTGRASRPNENP